ncbi:MAG TPA: LLM class flavin-dependent oxidoreductase [Candidatus Binatia bacterium]|jgi:alkanesulfonate monooxygenase SsuD/methylene tetrahydromethanopterin reductase-like flavin-dependent oxidoreductase (luciferase family)|nr:LLM class flavin-dependent oxidoreductase [Candidatus Binatia bacterium]
MAACGTFLIESLGGTLAEIRETALAAEAAGFDGLFFGENHFPEEGVPPALQGAWGLTSAPLTLATAIAACTTRIRVGTAVLALPLHHAVEVAKEAAAIDVLSNGRLVLGIGIGMEANGFREYGVPWASRVSRLEEGIAVLRGCWREDAFHFAGKRYRIDAAPILHPTRREIPVWMGAKTEPGLRRAARLGLPILLDGAGPFEEVKDLVAVYRAACAAAGTRPYVAAMRDVCLGATAADARRAYEEAVVARVRLYWQVDYLNPRHDAWVKTIRSAEEIGWERATRDRIIAGDPAACAEELRRWEREAGIDYFIIELLLPAGGRARALDDMRLFGRSVLPRLAG